MSATAARPRHLRPALCAVAFAATAPARPATDLPPPVDIDAITVPAKP